MNDTAQVKSTTLELTIDPSYVKSWGVWEAVRELLQNAADAHDQGYPAVIERGRGEGRPIKIQNMGTKLDRSTLLLGSTSKAGDRNARGQFGEGYKLAFVVLLRLGFTVRVHTGSEIWTPYIEHSDTFGKELLKIKVRPAKATDRVLIEVYGVDDASWEIIKERILFLTPPKKDDVIEVNGNQILTNDKYANKLFVKGIYVGVMPDGCAYGYNLRDVELDRDRRLADPWSLRRAIAEVLLKAIEAGSILGDRLFTMLQSDTGEAWAIHQQYSYGLADQLTRTVATQFAETYGADAVPVSNMAESTEATHHAMKGIMVSKALKVTIEREIGDFDSLKRKRQLDIAKRYSATDLDTEETENLIWACMLTHGVEPDFTLEAVMVVDFVGTTITGMFNSGEVYVAKRVLKNRRELISTVVHEVAHKFGGDGSTQHHFAMERIMGDIICAYATLADIRR